MIITAAQITENEQVEALAIEDEAIPEPIPATTLEWSVPWMGRTWNLTDPASPVFKMEGWKGLEGAAYDHWYSTAPTLDGATWGGMRVERGEVSGPVFVSGPDLATFLAEHALFLRSLNPAREGYLRRVRPDGDYRQIACRSDAPPVRASDRDMLVDLFVTYGLTFSTDPYWQGPAVERLFEYEVGVPFFPGPPFTLGKNFSIEDATITNPGDVEAFPTWRVTAPFTAFQVGVGGALVKATLTKATGYVDIDMNPDRLTVTDEAGVDRWSSLTDAAFTSIPPGDELPLALSVTGAAVGSSVRLAFVPRYWSAW